MAERFKPKIVFKNLARTLKNKKFRRSLYFTKDLDVGSKIELNQVSSIRPANGLHPKYLKKILGMKVNKKIKKGTPISWEDIE